LDFSLILHPQFSSKNETKKTVKTRALSSLLLVSLITFSAQAQKGKSVPSKKPAKTASTPAVTGNPDDAKPIMSIGKSEVPFKEFKYVYGKNNSNTSDANTDKSVREYVDLYVNFKLKVMDAEKEGLDTTNSFKKELEGYRKQLAKPYLTDKSVTEKLVKEAYDRMKEEVSASHILIKCDPKADPKDTLAAYNKAMDIRKKILGGESFEKLAKDKSDDPSAKYNDGNLGFFTAMQMVYPFEDVAYKTAKGAISNPVRTQFGYHLIKVIDKRPSQGQITVAHIMVKTNLGMPEEDSIAARKKIYDIYDRLKKGENFSNLALEFSEHPDSKTKGGLLPAFGAGTMVPSFENASFSLKDTGSYSAPFQTPYGWHIVRLKNRKLLESFEELKPGLETKVSKDSRSELNKSVLLNRLRKENGIIENKALIAYAATKADTNLPAGKWKYDMADKRLDETILSIKEKKYNLRDFFQFAEKKQQVTKSKAPDYQMKLLFKEFADQCVLDYEESHLTEKYEDYKMLCKEYRDGILLFTLMDKKVWTKALEDTTGLKNYHSENKSKYNWNQRVKATIFSAANQKALENVKSKLAARNFLVTDLKFDAAKFTTKGKEIGIKNGLSVKTHAENLKRDKSLTIEVTGFAAKDEKAGLALKRANHIADTLVSLGVERSRIMVKDSGKAGFLATPDDSRRVSFKVYSNSAKIMERLSNANEPLSLQVTDGLFRKEENKVIDQLKDWKQGNYTVDNNGRINYVVVEAIEAPREKTFDEARGAVISDYQNFLEKQWIDGMKAIHPVKIDETLVKKLITK
jgi:peptidyl-prolyl cis-trans isomerase SurA